MEEQGTPPNPYWKPHNIFFQADLINGFRYLDLTGIVLNRIANKFTQRSIDPNGAHLRSPLKVEDPFALRFSAERIWLQFTGEPDTQAVDLTKATNLIPEWVSGIARDLEVNRFSRLGLRIEHFVPIETHLISIQQKLLSYLTKIDDITESANELDYEDAGLELVFRTRSNRLTAQIRIAVVKISRPPVAPNEYPSDGLLLDIDVWDKPRGTRELKRGSTQEFISDSLDELNNLVNRFGLPILGLIDE